MCLIHVINAFENSDLIKQSDRRLVDVVLAMWWDYVRFATWLNLRQAFLIVYQFPLVKINFAA
jgi:hypothetical protein